MSGNLSDYGRRLGIARRELRSGLEEVMEDVGRDALGLARATVAARLRRRTGLLLDTMDATVSGSGTKLQLVLGSPRPYAVYHELGYRDRGGGSQPAIGMQAGGMARARRTLPARVHALVDEALHASV